MANLLLAHGASPDQAGKNGMTPLHIAAQYDQQAVASTLLEKGADAKVWFFRRAISTQCFFAENAMEVAVTFEYSISVKVSST